MMIKNLMVVVEPDWLLMYKYLDEDIVLVLVNTSSYIDILEWVVVKTTIFFLSMIEYY